MVEAGVDAIRVTLSGCPDDNPADFNNDGFVDGVDLASLLAKWGPCDECPDDINGDGVVSGPDIASLLAAWTGTRRHVRVRQLAVFAHAAGFAQRRVGTACSQTCVRVAPQ